jgi:hypothetical protein
MPSISVATVGAGVGVISGHHNVASVTVINFNVDKGLRVGRA